TSSFGGKDVDGRHNAGHDVARMVQNWPEQIVLLVHVKIMWQISIQAAVRCSSRVTCSCRLLAWRQRRVQSLRRRKHPTPSGNVALLPHVKKVTFDPLKDLTPVGRFVIQPTLIATNAALPVKTLGELVAMMKANPGKLKMSTAGAGTAGHFAGEMFIKMAGIKPVVVHYN